MPRFDGVELDPLVGLDDPRKPLRSKVLAVPALKARYLANVRKIAEESLDWKKLGPVVAQYRKLIEKEVEADTRKLARSRLSSGQRLTPPPAAGAAGRGNQPAGLRRSAARSTSLSLPAPRDGRRVNPGIGRHENSKRPRNGAFSFGSD